MPKRLALTVLWVIALPLAAFPLWPAPRAPRIPAARGYVPIANAAVAPDPARTYRAIFDAAHAAARPSEILPALNIAGVFLNGFRETGVPDQNVLVAVVFHGGALDAILDDEHYRAKHRTGNPNLTVLDQLRKAGVDLLVCGQSLAAENIEPGVVSPLVRIASSASIVLTDYQNRGYALLTF